jgi:alanine-glyoxylate transaminase / (R)-3-amino-2-methylpropionate-pyruvate transaminase
VVCQAPEKAWVQVVEEDGLQANSANVGAYLTEQFTALSKQHSIIGDVRGAGLMLGVEFVKDRTTKVWGIQFLRNNPV